MKRCHRFQPQTATKQSGQTRHPESPQLVVNDTTNSTSEMAVTRGQQSRKPALLESSLPNGENCGASDAVRRHSLQIHFKFTHHFSKVELVVNDTTNSTTLSNLTCPEPVAKYPHGFATTYHFWASDSIFDNRKN